MKLTDYQRAAVDSAVKAFLEYVLPERNDQLTLSSEHADDIIKQVHLANDLFVNTFSLLCNQPYGEHTIEENLEAGVWTTPAEVADYIEETY